MTGREASAAGWLRAGLLALAAIGLAGTAAELAFLRHWDGLVQLIPWAAVAVLGAAMACLAVRPSAARVLAARALGAVAAAAGLYGVYEHIAENYHAGPLDAVYGPKWESLPTLSRLWAAGTGGVGPAPTLAPAVLAQIALCLFVATLAHPALRCRPHPALRCRPRPETRHG
ncbi:MAG: hypothetical protein ACRDV9_08940 [Acidimicrobiia bacterium]